MMIINKGNNANFSGKGFVYKNLVRSNYFLFHSLEIHLAPQAKPITAYNLPLPRQPVSSSSHYSTIPRKFCAMPSSTK